MSNTSVEKQLGKLATQYPDSRTAVLPALRLAQEQNGGWLTLDSFELVGDALGLTPAYCQAVASFYDMFHLEPVGKYHLQVCRTTPCWLRGADKMTETCKKKLGIGLKEVTKEDAPASVVKICNGECF